MEPLVVSDDFPLPQVSEALAPYIKTRQEALRIRRILTLYLTSQIKSADGEVMNNIILSAPGSAVQMPKVPIELSGLHKVYLRALQANIMARNEYKELTRDSLDAKSDAKRHFGPKYSGGVEDRAERLSTYLSLLQERRKYEKLSILQDYLEMLSKKDVAKADYLSIDRIQQELPPMPEAPLLASGSASSDNDTELLIHRLERTVVRAKHTLDTEKGLIAKLKDGLKTEATNCESPDTGSGPRSRIAALCRTRDELIKWMEERLAGSGQVNEDASFKDSDRKLEGEDGSIEQRKAAIAAKYEQYLEARESMIAAASEAISNQGQGEGPKEDRIVDPQIESDRKHNAQQAARILPYLTEYLIPSARSQKAFMQQESHMTKSLSTQQKLTSQLLDRLANESHLLPKYPLLARQPRFINSVAALGPKQLSPPLNESRSTSEARAWAFAADAARSATHEVVDGRLEHGFTHVQNAEDVLDELKKMLGSDGVDEEGRGVSTDSEDMTMSGNTTERRHPKSKIAAQRRPEGIWNGFNGKVGPRNANPVESR